MNLFSLTGSNPTAQWLVFVAILLVIGLGITFFFFWLFGLRKYGKKGGRKRKRKHRYHGRANPTLAESGGLPPPRKPGEPPRGV